MEPDDVAVYELVLEEALNARLCCANGVSPSRHVHDRFGPEGRFAGDVGTVLGSSHSSWLESAGEGRMALVVAPSGPPALVMTLSSPEAHENAWYLAGDVWYERIDSPCSRRDRPQHPRGGLTVPLGGLRAVFSSAGLEQVVVAAPDPPHGRWYGNHRRQHVMITDVQYADGVPMEGRHGWWHVHGRRLEPCCGYHELDTFCSGR